MKEKTKKIKKLFGFTRLVKPFAQIWTRAMTWQSSCTRNLRKPSFANAHSYGFTLAEVLITLSILGVVAAITVPSLAKRNEERSTVTKVKKFYSALSEAVEQAKIENGFPSTWGYAWGKTDTTAGPITYEKLFKPYFNVSRNCGTATDCIASTYYSMNGTVNDNFHKAHYYKILLKDGTTVFTTTQESTNPKFIVIRADVNGKKGPNKLGYDVFAFYIPADNGDIIVPGAPNARLGSPISKCNDKTDGDACTAWVVYKGNMDYLRKNVSW